LKIIPFGTNENTNARIRQIICGCLIGYLLKKSPYKLDQSCSTNTWIACSLSLHFTESIDYYGSWGIWFQDYNGFWWVISFTPGIL